MIGLVKPLRDLLRVKSVDTTNIVWRLHNRATVYVLVFFTILLSARAYFGDPIDCITSAPSIVRQSMNSFCWTLGTYISNDPKFVRASWDFIEIGQRMGRIPREERVYQKYYQWVSFILAIQAFFFSLPKHLWRFTEGSRMETLCDGLTSILPPDAWNGKRRGQTLHYLTQEPRRKQLGYAFMFIFCELLNFVLVLLNMLLMNFIFGGFWYNYQPAITALLSLDMDSWISENSLVFPKLAKCEFLTVGPSGSKQIHDGLCLLPQNIVNEKIFAFLWLWFICLALLSGIQICYRLVQLSCGGIRLQLLYSRLAPVSYSRVKRVVNAANFGQWFILYQMARNVNRDVMKDIMIGLSKQEMEKELSRQSLEQPPPDDVEEDDTLEEVDVVV